MLTFIKLVGAKQILRSDSLSVIQARFDTHIHYYGHGIEAILCELIVHSGLSGSEFSLMSRAECLQ